MLGSGLKPERMGLEFIPPSCRAAASGAGPGFNRWKAFFGAAALVVLALDHEVGATDGAGKLGLLPGELEAGGQFFRHLHAVRKLEANRPLATFLEAVHDIDGQP